MFVTNEIKIKIMKISTLRNLLVVAMMLIVASCADEEIPDVFTPEYLVTSDEVIEYSKEDILTQIQEGADVPAEIEFLIRYGVKGVRLVYTTVDAQGNEVEASGALLIPIGEGNKPLVSFQHGTITSNEDAPSNFNSQSDIVAIMMASTGFAIAMPDYIGYGVSSHLPHPYEHKATLASATRDMIRATREYFKVNNRTDLANPLFLTGYSEGGSATMAAYQLMQEEHPAEFDITAVSVGAGAYNKSKFMNWVVSSTEELEFINSYVWVLDTYNKIYPQLQRPYSFYFNEPWATKISNEGVFAEIENNPSLLFTQEFIDGVTSGSDTEFLAVIEQNNSYSWIPLSPTHLYHGTADTYVPFFNSEDAYNYMIDKVATNVELFPINNGDHFTSIMQYAMGTFTFFFQML